MFHRSKCKVLRLRIKSRNTCEEMGGAIKPITKEGVNSSKRREVSLLSSHCLKLSQKEEVTVQFQKRWIRVSSSSWQKLQRSLSFRFIFLKKLLVASLLCKSLN